MTKTAWPFVNQPTTDLQYSKLFRQLQRSGVIGFVGDTSLKASAPGSTLTVNVAAGAAIVRGYYFENTSPDPQTHASGGAQQRIDRGVLRLDFAQPLLTRVNFAVIAGTPAATNPAIPALTQDPDGVWDIPIYRVLIPASATSIINTNVIDERQYIGKQGGQWTTDTRPTSPVKGDFGYNETLGYWEFNDGTAGTAGWKKLWQGVTWADIANKPNIPTQAFFTSDISPTNAQGANGDWWAEY